MTETGIETGRETGTEIGTGTVIETKLHAALKDGGDALPHHPHLTKGPPGALRNGE